MDDRRLTHVMLLTSFYGVFCLARVAAATACTPQPITCGQSVTASLGPNSSCILDTFPTAIYSFSAVAGQTVTLLAGTSSGNTIGLALLDPTGTTLTNAFDEPAGFSYTFTASGTYTIEVNFGDPHASGSFTLTTSCATSGTPPPTTCGYTATIAIGASVSGQLSAADSACGNSSSYAKAYRLPVMANDAFTLTYTATYPVYVEIDGPSGATDKSWVSKNRLPHL
jgi:hypothetical protein